MATVSDISRVEKGEADYAVIPIRKFDRGIRARGARQLCRERPQIVAQVHLEITHALISATPLEKIEKVYSKDQALAQCRHWLQRHLPHAQLIDAPSTSRAVQLAKAEPGAAAIASELAASFTACR